MNRPLKRPPRPEFERLVREHHAAVWRAAARAVRDRGLAEDAAQDVYAAVLEGRFVPERGEAEGRSLRWYAARRALELGRGEGRRRAREERHAMERDPADATPDDHDERARVLHHVEGLPDDLRAALRLRFEEEMTWDAVGAALAIAPSSAHERVQRALGLLRSRVRDAGFAVLALDVEARLPDLPTPRVPHGLSGRLLGLHLAAAAPAPAGALVALGLALAAATVGIASFLGRPPPAESATLAGIDARDRRASSADDPRSPAAPPARSSATAAVAPVPAPPSAAPDAATAVVEGRVVDPRGDPLEGLRIHAVRAGQKGGALPGDPGVASRADGGYRLEVAPGADPLEILAGDDTLGRALAASAPFRPTPGGTTRVADLVVDFPGASHPRGEWSLELVVADPGGRPVAGAIARVTEAGRDPWARSEAFGRTDDAGRVALAGGRLGARTLAIDASAQGCAPWSAPVELVGGRTSLRVTLQRGLEIRGRLTDLEGRSLGDAARSAGFRGLGATVAVMVDARDGGDGPDANVEADGTFRVPGLTPGAWTLRVFAPGRSPTRVAVEAGATDVEIALKPVEDERDVGSHAAEIHGRLADAATGEPVRAEQDAVEVDPLWDLAPDTALDEQAFERDVLPWTIFGRPVQRMIEGEPPAPSDRFHLVGLEARASALVARVPGYAPCVLGPVALGEREVRAGVTLALARPVSITGEVRDTDGAPLAGAIVVLVGEGPYTDRRLAEVDAEVKRTGRSWSGIPTDARGRFAFSGLPPGLRARLAVLHERSTPWVSDWVESGTSDLALRGGRPR